MSTYSNIAEVPVTDLPSTLKSLKSTLQTSRDTASFVEAARSGNTTVLMPPRTAGDATEIIPLRGPANFTSDMRSLMEVPLAPRSAAGLPGGPEPSRPVTKTKNPKDIVFVTAEAAPWSKTGGLGDVMGSLPISLAQRGHRVMVVMPRYLSPGTEKRYAGLSDLHRPTALDLGVKGGMHTVGFFHKHEHGVDWVFVDHMSFHR